jgi:hypothetical protein
MRMYCQGIEKEALTSSRKTSPNFGFAIAVYFEGLLLVLGYGPHDCSYSGVIPLLLRHLIILLSCGII